MDKRVRIVLFSACYNALLLVIKLAAGLLTGSVGVLAVAVNSGTDLVASLVALYAVRRSGAPPDERHNYGHGRAENLAGVFEGLVLLGVGAWVVFESVRSLVFGVEVGLLGIGVGALVLSVVANFFVSGWLLRKSREHDSRVMEAEGYNLRTDVWAEGGVAVGLVAAWATGWTVLDPLVALVMGGLILRTAVRLISGSTRVLIDERLPDGEMEQIEQAIADEVRARPHVLGFHKLRARKSGPQRHIDFHLQLEAETTLGEAHGISDALEERIRRTLPNSDILIHLEDDRSLRASHHATADGDHPPDGGGSTERL
jgi:cation diffusion facilitator family transporter